MDVVHQDCSIRKQEVDFSMAKRAGWTFTYQEFDYPTKEDKPQGAVRASLTIDERCPHDFSPTHCRYFNEVIYLRFDGAVSREVGEGGLFSPALARLKRLSPELRDEIRASLSDEARDLFDKGL